MRRLAATALGIAALAAAAFFWLSRTEALPPEALPRYTPDVAAGERLFHAGGCASCHGAGLAGGEALPTVFGTFFIPNITPHSSAGIGDWSDLDFVNAMSRGLDPDGRHYYPAFPYPSYARMTLTDLLDLKAWLDTFPPSARTTPEHDLKFPWNVRRGIGLWNRRYLDPTPVAPVDDETPERARGRYLVEAVGHCGECHTPRDRFGGPLRDRWLAGGPNPDGEGRVPNITPHGDGLADWSEKDIAWYLKSGFTPDFDTVGGSMVAVQENMALLSDEDRAAIARYLKSVPALPDL